MLKGSVAGCGKRSEPQHSSDSKLRNLGVHVIHPTYTGFSYFQEENLHPIIKKTFGGLSKPYYFRHFAFGLVFVALFVFMSLKSPNGIPINGAILFAVNAFLYPYSRFVYESVVGFIVGNNVIVLPAFVMLFVKLMTMLLCFMFAIFIAPIGLAYLYYHHTKHGRLG